MALLSPLALLCMLAVAPSFVAQQQPECAMHQAAGKACTDLRIVKSLGSVPATSIDMCCAACASLPACGAWTFHGVAAQTCTLADRASHPGVVAGASCGSRQPLPGPGPNPPGPPPDDNITVGEFTQPIDHFGQTPGTFQQTYAYWGGAWKGPGHPIFLVMPEEAGFNPRRLTVRNTIYDVAVEYYDALIVGIEHRFYGGSQPYGSSPTSAQLGFLTVEQSLEDVAAIQRHITALLGANASRWVVWGASYPGCLAAWYRVRYPQMSAGAVASSTIITTPLFSTSPMAYTATNVLGPQCTDAYISAGRKLDEMVETVAGRATLTTRLVGYASAAALSADQTSWYDFMSDMAAFIESAAGYNYPVVLQCELCHMQELCALSLSHMSHHTLPSTASRHGTYH
jgi:pimeloyl-ACP methyl ester carboxylesterase